MKRLYSGSTHGVRTEHLGISHREVVSKTTDSMEEGSEKSQPNDSAKGWKRPLMTRISENSLKRFKSDDAKKHWGAFCKSTSIHGMSYLVVSKKKTVDRLWWVFVVVFGLLAATYYVSRQWVKWGQTVIDANNEDSRVKSIHVPAAAFTICDNRKLNISLEENGTSEDKNLMYLICGDDQLVKFNYTEEHLFNLIPRLQMNCTLERNVPEIMEHWTSRCDKLFTRTLTDQGVCYTFNMMDPSEIFADGVEHGHESHGRKSDWHMVTGFRDGAKMFDNNYTDSRESGSFPKRGDNAVLLSLYHENNLSPQYCYGDTDGYKIILHNPDEFPMVGNRDTPWVPLEKKTKDKYLVLPAFKKSLVDYKTRMLFPADSMTQYHYKQRKCYLQGEKPLSYFKIYSYNNCQLECITNMTKERCKCIDYYMPRKVMPGEPENITQVCTDQLDAMCVIYIFDLWDRQRDFCECLPACSTIEHDIVAWVNNKKSIMDDEMYEGMLVTQIVIYSTDEFFIKSERRPMYTLVDFIADCGGVFGLFCGMSIISIVEFFYYWVTWLIGRSEEAE